MTASPRQTGGMPPLVAEVVRRHRDQQGLSDSELSRQTLIARSTLQRLLVTGDFSASHMERLAQVFGTVPSALFAEAEGVAA